MATRTFVCAECRGTFETEQPDEVAQQEALETFGRRGDAPGMAEVCDDCYRTIMSDLADTTPAERRAMASLSAAFARMPES